VPSHKVNRVHRVCKDKEGKILSWISAEIFGSDPHKTSRKGAKNSWRSHKGK